MNLKSFISVILAVISFFVLSPSLVSAQQLEQFEARILEVSETNEADSPIPLQKIQADPTEGRFSSETIEILHPPSPGGPQFKVGDKVVIDVSADFEGRNVFYISDYVRTTPLYLLFGLFIAVVLFFARKKGFYSLLSMGFSFLVIFFFLIPAISGGYNPIISAVVSSIIILPVTFFVSHGLNKTTVSAALSTLLTILMISVLMVIFVEAAKLTGFASEEASFIKAIKGDSINIKGLLYAGILIAIIGILDDITTAQASLVFRLKKTAEKISNKELYFHAMEVGKDHISSLVNTLILVYTGASLPLLLLFTDSGTSFTRVINYEIIAEEIVRILIASIGLVLAVPLTTYISIKILNFKRKLV